MSKNAPKPQTLYCRHILKAFYYLPTLSVKIGSIHFSHLVECYALCINSWLISFYVLCIFQIYYPSQKSDINCNLRIIFIKIFIIVKVSFIKIYTKKTHFIRKNVTLLKSSLQRVIIIGE